MAGDQAAKKPDEGWTPEQKGKGSPGDAGGGGHPGACGEAKPKALPTDDRAAAEGAAAELQKESGEGQPS